MQSESHYRLYMPKQEESSRLVGCFTLLLFMVFAFGAIIGSAYLYTTLKHKWRESDIETSMIETISFSVDENISAFVESNPLPVVVCESAMNYPDHFWISFSEFEIKSIYSSNGLLGQPGCG